MQNLFILLATESQDFTEKIITSSFWHDLFTGFINWAKEELPSIAILVLLFLVLMYVLTFITHRMKKMPKKLSSRYDEAELGEISKRRQTIAGIIKNIGKVFLWVIFIILLLGKINIDIAPLLASAGIIGLAIGFGAQELVRDFISGFFILLEDQIRTGDFVTINGISGTVENIEMRTITIRDGNGIVHIVQNGKINDLANQTKGYSAILLNIGIAYKEDTDRVSEVIQGVADELRKDSKIGGYITAFDLLGVNDFADSAVVILVKFTTKPGQQWAVGREFRRRLKKTFDKENIEIPFPHVSLYTGEATKPMPVVVVKKEETKN
ncbi:MAG: mechanosensitive ion channel family protein [Culturomica sp.]|jgi:small conductance mechanosensitive channel|nr:mechanosensitive ion channel family protein [Culturomica sp.]